jgi:hypothetical protein
MLMNLSENLLLVVPATESERPDMFEPPFQRLGDDIVSRAGPDGGLVYGGCGDARRADRSLIEIRLDFFFNHFDLAVAALRRVGDEMGWPSGTILKHVVRHDSGDFNFKDLETW